MELQVLLDQLGERDGSTAARTDPIECLASAFCASARLANPPTCGRAELLSSKDVYAWRLTVPVGHRFEATQALRQVLNRAVAWGLLDFNPAKRGVANPQRRPKEKRPFESWAQIEAIAAQLGPVYGPMVIFSAATGLRPSELFGLEQHDIDRRAGVVYVRRAFANGRVKNTKTRLSTRAVPLQAKAVEALDRLPASVNPILFPNACGGRIDFRVFGRRHWRAAQIAAGIEPIRGLYDLRHTYATFALRAGVPVFAVSRFIGSSIAMIDRHYGHLARDSYAHAVSLLDELALERAVDAAWTSHGKRANALNNSDSKPYRRRNHRRVDARWTPRLVVVAPADNKRSWSAGTSRSPLTDSNRRPPPYHATRGSGWQRLPLVLAIFRRSAS